MSEREPLFNRKGGTRRKGHGKTIPGSGAYVVRSAEGKRHGTISPKTAKGLRRATSGYPDRIDRFISDPIIAKDLDLVESLVALSASKDIAACYR